MALLPVEDALNRILSGVKPVSTERVALDQALHRVLTASVKASRDQPPFAASAMDGYAMKQTDISTLPASLKIAGTSAAGHAYGGRLNAGEAIRILTGAPLPEGADTIVIQENTRHDHNQLTVLEATPAGKHIRRVGLDFAKGDVLVEAPKRLRPRDLGLAAAGNAPFVRVRKKPRVVLFTTGDELVLPGQRTRADQIISSNSHAIAAMVQTLGADVINLGIVKDNLKATMASVRRAMTADVLVTTGGASVGDHDYVQEAFKACGIRIDFWKIAMRPGKPFMYGRKGKLHVMGLPGNPVSALVTARLFLQPLLEALSGLPQEAVVNQARLGSDMQANDNRQDYVRASLNISEDGARCATPFSLQDSSMQRTLQKSHCLIVRPPAAAAAKRGDLVPVLLLDF